MKNVKKALAVSTCVVFLASSTLVVEAAPKATNPGKGPEKVIEKIQPQPKNNQVEKKEEVKAKEVKKEEIKSPQVNKAQEKVQNTSGAKAQKAPKVKTQAQIEAELQELEEAKVFEASIQKAHKGAKAIPGSKIKIKGKNVKFDVPPVIKEGRTLIPVRAIMNGLKAEVVWNQATQTVTITRDGIVVELILGSAEVKVNGETVVIDVPAQAISNRTFVPLRFLAQVFGEKVVHNPDTGEISIGDEEDEDLEDEDSEDQDIVNENDGEEDINDEELEDEERIEDQEGDEETADNEESDDEEETEEQDQN